MLNSIDTLVAFALIFTVVSLLITIVVQIFASVCNLRGKNLAWGMLRKPSRPSPRSWSRASVLRAKLLADHLLKDPLISDWQLKNTVKLASSVRADEIFDLLHRIATGKKPGTPAQIKDDAVALFKALGVPDSVFAVVAAEKADLEAFVTDLKQAVQSLPDGSAKDAATIALQQAQARLANMTTDAEASAAKWTAQGEQNIQRVYQKFEQWFETGQERSQEWFTTHGADHHGRFLGLLFAFLLQLEHHRHLQA